VPEVGVPKRRIFTVGLELPGAEFEFVGFDSDQTLLDADIILFQPTLGNFQTESYEQYNGKPILTHHSSFATKGRLDHWRSEIVAAVNAGKLVIIYLAKPVEYCRYTGEKQFSGTGRSRVQTNIVTNISSYEAVPNVKNVTPKSGSEIRLEKDGLYLTSYWTEFSDYSPYEVEIEGEFNRVVLRSRTGNRTVGAAFHGKTGVLLLLPPLRYDEELFFRDAEEGEDEENTYWTEEALKFGKRLVAALVGIDDALKKSTQLTAAPVWSSGSEYRLARESELETSIAACTTEIIRRQSEKANLERQLEDAGNLRRLLFEQGKPLELIVLEAMKTFGFDARHYSNGESEFDGVFMSPEGRCLGEAEGKDNKAINIDKFSQLERNLQEDFARDDVTEYAKGILFGNAYRLKPVNERAEFFTDKCISAAKRIKGALIRTPDLFAPAKYLKENPSDSQYAKGCREAIFATDGAVVTFPSPPIVEISSLVEGVHAEEGVGLNVDATSADTTSPKRMS
jgi:hypothetical protein